MAQSLQDITMARKRGSLKIDLSNPRSLNNAIKALERSKRYYQEGGKRRMVEMRGEVQTKFINPMLMELGFEPGDSPPGNFAKRSTPKQRRYYFWAVRTGKINATPDGKYIRSHNLSGGWRAEVELKYGTRPRMILRTTNHRSYHIFVVGKISLGQSQWSVHDAVRPVQKFHTYTGWLPVAPVIQKWYGRARTYVRSEWLKWAQAGLPH